jgi:hypothetical protein
MAKGRGNKRLHADAAPQSDPSPKRPSSSQSASNLARVPAPPARVPPPPSSDHVRLKYEELEEKDRDRLFNDQPFDMAKFNQMMISTKWLQDSDEAIIPAVCGRCFKPFTNEQNAAKHLNVSHSDAIRRIENALSRGSQTRGKPSARDLILAGYIWRMVDKKQGPNKQTAQRAQTAQAMGPTSAILDMLYQWARSADCTEHVIALHLGAMMLAKASTFEKVIVTFPAFIEAAVHMSLPRWSIF